MKDERIILILNNESLLHSILSDLVTFGFLLLCIYISVVTDSAWWTFFLGVMAVLFVLAKSLVHSNYTTAKFRNMHELSQWVEDHHE